jgi:hypothetical protein
MIAATPTKAASILIPSSRSFITWPGLPLLRQAVALPPWQSSAAKTVLETRIKATSWSVSKLVIVLILVIIFFILPAFELSFNY